MKNTCFYFFLNFNFNNCFYIVESEPNHEPIMNVQHGKLNFFFLIKTSIKDRVD